MIRISRAVVAFAICGTTAAARAQQPTRFGALPPLRTVGPITAAPVADIDANMSLRPLSNGMVLASSDHADDIRLYSASLSVYVPVSKPKILPRGDYSYGGGRLFPYVGDSSLRLARQPQAIEIVDAGGHIVRRVPFGDPQHFDAVYRDPFTTFDGVDALFFLLRRQRGPTSLPNFPYGADSTRQVGIADSGLVVRLRVGVMRTDTLASISLGDAWYTVYHHGRDTTIWASVVNPFVNRDVWTVSAEGRLMIAHASGGAVTRAAPVALGIPPVLPHDAIAIRDIERPRIVDSIMGTADSSGWLPVEFHEYDSVGMGHGGSWGAETRVVRPGQGRPNWSGNVDGHEILAAENLPTVRPLLAPVPPVRAPSGRVWIEVAAPGLGLDTQYDVVDADGNLVDRVRIPSPWKVAAVGTDKVYLISKSGEKARLGSAPIR